MKYLHILAIDSVDSDIQPNRKMAAAIINEDISQSQPSLKGSSSGSEYWLQSELGKGKFGTVYLATRQSDNQVVAIKFINLSNTTAKRALYEYKILHLLGGICVPTVYETILTESPKTLHIVMELIKGDNLRVYKQKNPIITAAIIDRYFDQVIECVTAMHDRNIVHRDIKLENLIIDEHTIKLVDFGTAVALSLNKQYLAGFAGTPRYISNIIWKHVITVAGKGIRGQPHSTLKVNPDNPLTNIDAKLFDVWKHQDIWSVCIIFYYLITNRFPFVAKTLDEMQEVVVRGDYLQPLVVGTENPRCSEFINMVLSK